MEMRIPGADANPYLAFAAVLASGLAGVRAKLEPPAQFVGDAYSTPGLPLGQRDAVLHGYGVDVLSDGFMMVIGRSAAQSDFPSTPFPPVRGFGAARMHLVPTTLKDASAAFQASAFARGAFGDVIVDHYATFFDNEVLAFERAVTDFEMRRYFEQI